MQDNITIEQFSNYLDSGALLRHQDRWHLYVGENAALQGFTGPCTNGGSNEALVQAPFFFDTDPSYSLKSESEDQSSPPHFIISTESLYQLCQQIENSAELPEIVWNAASKDSFFTSFKFIQEKIKEGGLKKAVPIVFEHSSWVPDRKAKVLFIKQLIQAPSNLWVYGFWDHQLGLLGASPEILFEYDSQHLKTMALAGTRGKTEERGSLLADAKELKEHQLVVTDLQNQLMDWGSPKVHRTFEVELPSLFHLCTPIELNLNSPQPIAKIIQKLHPTPALGVAPRQFDFKWMQNLPEQHDRRFFGSPITFKISHNRWICVVGIRCLDWTASGSRIGSGCGIIEESQLEREWEELSKKRASVKFLLQLETKKTS